MHNQGGYKPEIHTVTLQYKVCTNLALLYYKKQITKKTGSSILTIAHEAMHASLEDNWEDETTTECRAVPAARTAIVLLKAQSLFDYLWPQILADHKYVRSFPGYADFPCTAHTLA